MPEMKLSQGQVHYRDEGTGAPVVLIHGLLVNGTVWDEVVPRLAPQVRCIAPDLPLGSQREAMNLMPTSRPKAWRGSSPS